MSVPCIRRFWILWGAILFTVASVHHVMAEVEFNKDYTSIQLTDGVVLKRARVTRFEAGIFHVEHSGGIARVPEAKMPAEWRAIAVSQPSASPAVAAGSNPRAGQSPAAAVGAGRAESPVTLEELMGSPADFIGKGFLLQGIIAPSAEPRESGNGYLAYAFLSNQARVSIFMPEGDAATRLNAHLAPKGGEAQVVIYCVFEPATRQGAAANELRVVAVDWLTQEEAGNATLSRAALDRARQFAQARITRDAVKRANAPATAPTGSESQLGQSSTQMSFGIGDMVTLNAIGLSPVPFTLMEIGNGSILVRIGRTGAVQKVPLKVGIGGTRTEVYRDPLGTLYYIDSAARPNGKGLFEVVRQPAPSK